MGGGVPGITHTNTSDIEDDPTDLLMISYVHRNIGRELEKEIHRIVCREFGVGN